MLQVLESTDVKPIEQLDSLRMLSHRMFLKALQMREMLGIYRDVMQRENLYVMFIMQVVDMHNEKQFRVRFEDELQLQRLQDRLGYAGFFPFVQIEQTHFYFDFQRHDHRLAANALMQITAKEGWKNLTQYVYTHADGTVDPLPAGIPRSWEVLEK